MNECLSSPNLVFRHKEFMRATGLQPLLGSRSSFSHQQRNAMPAGHKLASQSEVSRQIAKAFSIYFFVQFYVGCHKKIWSSHIKWSNEENSLQSCSASWILVDY